MEGTERLLQDALNILSLVELPEGPSTKQDCANMAQVYCLTAIAQELKRLNDRLDSMSADCGYELPGLRVLVYGIDKYK